MIISLFPTYKAQKGESISVEETLARIQGCYWQSLVEPVRALKGVDERRYKDEKFKLPVLTPSGFFKDARRKIRLTKHSGFIGLDIDQDKNPGIDLAEARKRVEADKHTYACFSSVSGIGFLALVRLPRASFPDWKEPEKDWEKEVEAIQVSYYKALESHYLQAFNLATDNSCTDVSRARFVSYDLDLYHNVDALVWEGRQTPQPKPKPVKVKHIVTVVSYGETVLQRALKMVAEAVQGTKHTALRDAAHLCGGYIASGCLDEARAYDLLYNEIASKDGVESMANAENLIKTGFSKGGEKPVLPPYVNKRIINYAGSNLNPSDVALTIATEEGLDPERIESLVTELLDENSGVFWNVEFDERKGKNIVDIQRQKLTKWLVQQGFRVRANGKDADFFQLSNNIVKRVHPIHISRFTADYLSSLPLLVADVERTQIEEAMLRAVGALFSVDLLRTLPWLEGEFLRDTAQAAYYFYRNVWVEVSAAGIVEKSYEDLPALIWDTQVKPHDFSVDEAAISPFHQFMINVTAKDADRLLGLQRALGYLMHSYKDVANSRALILMDETASFGKSEGGTGKGLLLQSVEQMIPMVTLPGATFKFEDAFKFELVNPDTRVVFMDEWDAQRLPFKSIFQEITGNLIINRKHEQSFSIPFAESPKFAFGTNQVIVSEGSSHQRRKIEIMVANHYSAVNLPIDEFKHRFFLDWDAQQWNAFYNLALGWVADYLKNGVVLTEFAGLEDRIIAQKAGIVGKEFLELVKELKTAKDRIWAKDAWEDFIGSSGIEPKFFSLRKFNELMELAGFTKEKCQERGGLGMVNRYHQIFFLAPEPLIPALSEENPDEDDPTKDF
jgi:hypothetical protein